jgi:hypothetical protein
MSDDDDFYKPYFPTMKFGGLGPMDEYNERVRLEALRLELQKSLNTEEAKALGKLKGLSFHDRVKSFFRKEGKKFNLKELAFYTIGEIKISVTGPHSAALDKMNARTFRNHAQELAIERGLTTEAELIKHGRRKRRENTSHRHSKNR